MSDIMADMKWLNLIVTASPQISRDLFKGASSGLVVTLPFLAIWLSFTHPNVFKLEYMKEISLLLLWVICLVHVLPLKSLKAGKDGVQMEFFSATPVPPEQAGLDAGKAH